MRYNSHSPARPNVKKRLPTITQNIFYENATGKENIFGVWNLPVVKIAFHLFGMRTRSVLERVFLFC